MQSGLSAFADPERPLIPNNLSWAGNDALVVASRDFEAAGPVVQNSYYLDLSAETVTPLIDLSSIQERTELFNQPENGEPPLSAQLPLASVAMPDGSGVVYLGMGSGTNVAYLWWKALPTKPRHSLGR